MPQDIASPLRSKQVTPSGKLNLWRTVLAPQEAGTVMVIYFLLRVEFR
jgi:hypothetical protein